MQIAWSQERKKALEVLDRGLKTVKEVNEAVKEIKEIEGIFQAGFSLGYLIGVPIGCVIGIGILSCFGNNSSPIVVKVP